MRNFGSRVVDRGLNSLVARLGSIARTGGSFDVIDVAFWRAATEAAEYYEAHFGAAKAFTNTVEMICDGIRIADSAGLFLEFGVASGRTIRAIAEMYDGPVFGFDSFEGLPEDWYEGYRKGHFARSDLPQVPANVTLIKGLFQDTLPAFLEAHDGSVSYVNVDCDLYSSSSFVLRSLANRLRPGTVIHFDEYFNYPGWRKHEFKAFQELVADRKLTYRYHSFLRTHQAVCVVLE
jgi:hypothetical protein